MPPWSPSRPAPATARRAVPPAAGRPTTPASRRTGTSRLGSPHRLHGASRELLDPSPAASRPAQHKTTWGGQARRVMWALQAAFLRFSARRQRSRPTHPPAPASTSQHQSRRQPRFSHAMTPPDDHPPAGVGSLWRLRGYLKPHAVSMSVMAAAALAAVSLSIAIPLVTKAIIDGPIAEHRMDAVL